MPLVVSPLVIGLTVLFSAATILLSAWIPARRASRVSPIDAIRQSGEIQEGKPLNLRTSPLIRRVFGFEGELALKSLQRDRKKYLTTLLSLMISIILFVAFNALMLYTDTTPRMAVKAMNYDLHDRPGLPPKPRQAVLPTWSASCQKCSGFPTTLPLRAVRPPARGDHRPGVPGPAGAEQP